MSFLKSLLRNIWNDIQQGENLDLYITILVSLVLVILNVLGIASQSLVAPLNLAVLALIAVGILANRHQLEAIQENLTRGVAEVFNLDFSVELQREIEKRIQDSKDLLIMGTNLGRTLQLHSHLFKNRLQQGKTLRVVLVDPDSIACDVKTKRHYRSISSGLMRATIQSTLNTLSNLHSLASGKIDVRLIDYPISRGAIVVDPDTPKGTLYLWEHAFKARRAMKFVLRAADGYWYRYFREEIRAIWDDSVAWQQCQKIQNGE